MNTLLPPSADAVGRALIADGHELERPLATYGTASARQLMKLRPQPKIVAVRQLLVSLRSDKTLSLKNRRTRV